MTKQSRQAVKTGRPRKEPPPDAAQVIRDACAQGASQLGVAAALGVCKDVLIRWMDESAELKEAFDQGREKERHTLHNVLYRLATEQNDKISAMFLLKARHGYVEGQQESQANRVSINFSLPGALPLQDFKVIEHGDSGTTTERIPAPSTGTPRRA